MYYNHVKNCFKKPCLLTLCNCLFEEHKLTKMATHQQSPSIIEEHYVPFFKANSLLFSMKTILISYEMLDIYFDLEVPNYYHHHTSSPKKRAKSLILQTARKLR